MFNTRSLLVTNILEKDYGEPVGILFLASYLRNEGFIVDIFDPQINGDMELVGLEHKCKEYPYDFVGISVLTSADNSIDVVTRMSKVIRAENPNAVIGCGGVGASLRYEEFVGSMSNNVGDKYMVGVVLGLHWIFFYLQEFE